MDLSRNIIKRYVEVVTPVEVSSNDKTVYGTIVGEGDSLSVKIDGSDILTPVTSTIDVRAGDRVLVLIKNHEAMVLGSPTSPTARLEELRELEQGVSEFEVILADKVGTGELVAMQALIDELEADNATITGKLEANVAQIETLTAENAEINGKLNVYQADVEELQAKDVEISGKLTAVEGDIQQLDVDKLSVTQADARYADIESLKSVNARIDNLDVGGLTVEEADIRYANIDFTNINEAAVVKIFSESGIIKDLVVDEGAITGELVGVTIKGDLIEGNTVKADKLVVKGSNGLYYQLNFESGAFADDEAVPDDGLHGSVIVANSITAEKINVKDLVAFGATIGGFHITDSSLYSGVKESIDNITTGVYLGNDGQVAFGDETNFVKFYKTVDETTGEEIYKLDISAESLRFGAEKKNVDALETQIVNLESNTNGLNATVSKLSSDTNETLGELNDQLTDITEKVNAQITPEQVTLEVQKIVDNGVTRVETTTGFTFDEAGMSVAKGEMKTQITEDGMTVYKGEDDDIVLTANSTGVDAKNLKATTYLIVGKNSRFEDYGSNRTGCFWIGD